jgi:hypothetical protein
VARFAGSFDVPGLADAGVQQEFFEFAQIGRRERFALPQLMQHDVVFMRFQEMLGLLLEAREVSFADLRQQVFDAIADLVGKIRVDHRLSRFFDMLDEIVQPQPHQFESAGRAMSRLTGCRFYIEMRSI